MERELASHHSLFIIHYSYFSVASVRRSIQRLQVPEPLASVSRERELLGLAQDGERPRALPPDEIDLREAPHGVLLAGKHLQDGEKASLGFGIFLLVKIRHSFEYVGRGIVPVFLDDLPDEEKRLVVLGQEEMRKGEPQSILLLQPAAAYGLERRLIFEHRRELLLGKLAARKRLPVAKDARTQLDRP